jgi:hypothetical protein
MEMIMIRSILEFMRPEGKVSGIWKALPFTSNPIFENMNMFPTSTLRRETDIHES